MPEITMTLSRKAAGEAAELAFMARAAALGLIVSKPLGDNASYDVIVGSAGRLLRVQVKSISTLDGGRYSLTAARGCSKRAYTASDIDLLVVFIVPLDLWYIIPVEALGTQVRLHLHPHRSAICRFEPYRERWDLLTRPGPHTWTAGIRPQPA